MYKGGCSQCSWNEDFPPNIFAFQLLTIFKKKKKWTNLLPQVVRAEFNWKIIISRNMEYENPGFWNISKNVLSQWDRRILKSAISQEKIDESTWFLAWWCRFEKYNGNL